MAGHSIPVGVSDLYRPPLQNSQGGYIHVAPGGYTGPVTLKSSDGQLTPITIQLVNGQEATPVSIKLTKVDTLEIEATIGTTTATSNGITINPAIAKSLKIIGPSVAVPVNAWNQIDIVTLDAYGNVATTGGDIQITSSLPGLLLSGADITPGPNGPEISMTNGKATFFALSAKAETDTLHYSFEGMTATETVTFG
jgi:hypothetical protein